MQPLKCDLVLHLRSVAFIMVGVKFAGKYDNARHIF